MSVNNEHITIPKKVNTGDDLDFQYLKEKGLEYIQQLSHDLWTDYNAHDPGITILEMLSYAITDLGMRIDMPIENILASEDKGAKGIEKQFFTATQILPSQPVTVSDYRKLFIDIDGVKNCWLQAYEKRVYADCKSGRLGYKPFKNDNQYSWFGLQGLYSILVDLDEPDNVSKTAGIKRKIEEVYHANRNLCEDLVEIKEVETQDISVCARIDVKPDADEELVHAKVVRAIERYLSPPVRFYSLKEMLGRGYPVDEIFEGPVLNSGFIDTGELEGADLRTEVRLSDIIQIIMKIEGVNVIKEISISDCKNKNTDTDQWLLCVDPGKKPVLCDKSAFSYYKGVLPLNISKSRFEKYLSELEAAEKAKQKFPESDMGLEIPEGVILETDATTTIQNDFPDTYGIGAMGLPASADVSRKSKAKQLKGYLLFFDQILASYFAHLGKVKDLLSIDNKLRKTYFTQAVSDIKDFDEIVNEYDTSDREKLTTELFGELDNNIERKNILLDHLIARFAENMNDYVFLMKKLYGTYSGLAVISSKEKVLSEYGDVMGGNGEVINRGISNRRGSAFNYFRQKNEQIWNTDNVAGVQKRISRLAGIKDYRRRDLSASFVDVYGFTDSQGRDVYRWRIRNEKDEIILSSTENYNSRHSAEAELYFAILKVVETPASVVAAAFKGRVADEQEIGNFEIQVSKTGRYSFNVIDPDAPVNSSKRIIARQFTYENSATALRDAILELIKFFTTTFTEEGMFVVEHILLRPDVSRSDVMFNQFLPVCSDGCECQPLDPYSFRVTVVLPGWTYRFSDPDFRKFLEDMIRKEMPAHILARICWIGDRKVEVENEEENEKTEMELFETAYRKFLIAKTKAGQEQNIVKLRTFIKILSNLNSVYPAGSLLDCKDEEDRLENKIVLGNTHIGNL